MASKKTAGTKKNAPSAPKLRVTVNHTLTNIYIVLLFTVFPLFQSQYFSATRRDKFALFLIFSGIAGVAVGAVALANYLGRNNEYNKKLNTYHDPFKLSLTDIGIGAFLLTSFVSTLASFDPGHCLFGLSYDNMNTGRNMGLLMILAMAVCYLVISRYFFSRRFVYYAMFIGITLVVGLAVLNFHRIDPLGIFDKYANQENVQMNFTSTIGNKNYLSALVCVSLMFSFGMAISTNNKVMRVIAFVSTAIQFMGLLVATSDGGFLGFFAGMAVLLVIASRNSKKLMWYFLGFAIMMLSAKVLSFFKDSSKGYSSFSSFFIESNLVYAFALVGGAIFALLYFLGSNNKDFSLPGYLFYIVLGVIGLVVVAVIGLFVYYSAIDTTTALAKDDFRRFFRFNDNWGTHRGFFWKRSFEAFGNMDFFQKLFGAGPETYYFEFEPFFRELNKLYGETSSNAAHNVYINYLITHGIVGLAAYLTFIGAAIVRCFKKAKENPLAYVCLGVIVAYATQDIVNIANPINTPWFIVFIGLAEACVLRANRHDRLMADNF